MTGLCSGDSREKKQIRRMGVARPKEAFNDGMKSGLVLKSTNAGF